MAQLILIRHGVTVDNQAGRLMGRNDSPLTEETKKQAQALGHSDELKNYLESVATIWASPLPRALETARLLVGDRNITIETSDALTERDFGIYNGQILQDMWDSGDAIWKSAEGDYAVRPENGESLEDVERRVLTFLEELDQTTPADQHIIVVGHSTVWRLVAAILNRRRKFPLEEKIAGPLSVQLYPREDMALLAEVAATFKHKEK